MPRIEVERTWPADCLSRLIKDYRYWNARGISDATLEPFRGGVATTGQLANRFVFPLFGPQGDIIGFDGRYVLPIPLDERGKDRWAKWKILGPSSRFIWGGIEAVAKSRRAVLAESIGDSLKLIEHGVPDVLCLFGTNLSQTLLAKMIELNVNRVIISTNLDTERVNLKTGKVSYPGQDAARKITGVLSAFFDESQVVTLHPEANDWGDSTPEQIRHAFGLDSQSNPTTVERT